MYRSIFGLAFTILAVQATAGTPQGVWASNPAHCSGPYPETQVRIAGDTISFIETSCKLDNPTTLRGMPQAKLYDVTCSGEGETWSQRVFIGTDGDGLLIYSDGGASRYQGC